MLAHRPFFFAPAQRRPGAPSRRGSGPPRSPAPEEGFRAAEEGGTIPPESPTAPHSPMKRSPIVPLLALLVAWLLAPTAPAKAYPTQDPAAAPTPPAKPFLWRIERGEAKGYLYGTIHLPDARALTIPEPVQKALDASIALYAEIETTREVEQQVQMAALLSPGGRLDRMVGPETWARVEARIKKAGLPAA